MSSELAKRLLTGSHRCQLDDKGRMNFPAKLREKMGETFWVARWLDNCLIAMPEEKFSKMDELLEQQKMSDGDEFLDFFYGAAEDVTPDKQGRILLSHEHREHIDAGKELVVVGMGRYAKIWTPEAREKQKDGFKDSSRIKELMKEAGL